MNDREKQIEEMANDLADNCAIVSDTYYDYDLQSACNDIDYKKTAENIYALGYRLCGGDSCPKFKHYKAECEHCTKVMEIKQACIVESAKKHAVKEAFEKLKKCFIKHRPTFYKDATYEFTENELDELFTELYGAEE